MIRLWFFNAKLFCYHAPFFTCFLCEFDVNTFSHSFALLNYSQVLLGSVLGVATNAALLSQILLYQKPKPLAGKEKKTK